MPGPSCLVQAAERPDCIPTQSVGTRERPGINDPYGDGKLDARSDKQIRSLEAPVGEAARQFILQARANWGDVRITDGYRTYEEQNAKYAQGRTAPGRKVTNVAAGNSNHNFAVAFDIGVFTVRNHHDCYLDESHVYDLAGPLGKSFGLAWGGDWHNPVDKPHYEWPHGFKMSQLRELHRLGASVTYSAFISQQLAYYGVN